MSPYETLGIPPHASRSEVLLAYNRTIAVLHPRKNADVNSRQQFITVQKAFEVLSRHATRAHYDALSRQASPALHRNPTDPIEELTEAYKSKWRYFFGYPAWLMTEKICVEVFTRVVLSIIGGFVGFLLPLSDYSARLNQAAGGVSESELAGLTGEFRAAVVLFAVVFFFSREIYLALRWVVRRYLNAT